MKKRRGSKVLATTLALMLALTMVLPLNIFASEEVLTEGTETAMETVSTVDASSSEPDTPVPPAAQSVSAEQTMSETSSYTVSFYLNDALAFQQTVPQGASVTEPAEKPAAPEGMRFVGWFEENAAEPYIFTGSAVAADLSLYAVFEAVPPQPADSGNEPGEGTLEEETDTTGENSENNNSESSTTGEETLDETSAEGASSASEPMAASFAAFSMALPQLPAVADEEYTVTFVVDGQVYDTVTVEKDTLVALPVPTSEESSAPFLGWYAEGESLPFSAYRLVESDLTLTAKFSENVLVTYLDTDGTELEVFEVEKDELAPLTGKSPALSMGQQFLYWTQEGSDEEYKFDTPLAKSIRLVPKLADKALAVFVTQGSEIEPQTGPDRFTAEKPETDPTREGYLFAGWSSSAEGTDDFDFDTEISGTVFIYAKWEAAEVDYILNYWVESVDGSGNDLVYTKQMEKAAVTGETLRVDEAQAAQEAKSGDKSVTDLLCYSTFSHSDEKEASAFGDTVINLYYTRTEFTFFFDATVEKKPSAGYSVGGGRSLAGEILLADGTNVGSTYTLTVKLGQDVTGVWPHTVNFGDAPYAFRNWSDYYGNGGSTYFGYNNIAVAFSAPKAVQTNYYYNVTKPVRTEVTLYPTLVENPYRETRHYYTEITEEERAAMSEGDYISWSTDNPVYPGTRYYKLSWESVVTNQSSNPKTTAQNWPGTALEGFEQIGAARNSSNTCKANEFQRVLDDPNGTQGKDYIIQYFMPRKTNTLTFVMNGGALQDADSRLASAGGNYTAQLPYQTALTSLLPTAANVTKQNYKFEGWYTDEQFHVEYTGGTMPESGLTLFAKYSGTEITVRYLDGENEYIRTYARGEKLTQHDLVDTPYDGVEKGDPVPGKGTFLGWYYEVGSGTRADVEFPLGLTLTRDEYVLTADFEPEDYTVTFQGDEGGSNLVIYDTQKVKSGSRNTLARSGHLRFTPNAREGYAFKGWSTSLGATTPNFTTATRVLENTTVYAVWEILPVNLTFDSNNGAETTEVVTYTMEYGQSLREAGLPVPGSNEVTYEGHTLAGWYTRPEEGEVFEPATA
ncbi:InlB B-repeat-containing protein, partial [Ruminococcaceae bacterium OttesenSCG-928-I18]|nr:InlB B-repeat-containing protein [Ruminococcaceae bacterium OttesenSCG-928-I18]